MIHEHRFTTHRSARYYTLGDPARCREVWFVCHGYGQLAAYFIRHFEALADGGCLIVAPEALSRFYLEDPEGGHANARVGATWMTREDRLSEIEDYVAYLDGVYRAVMASAEPRTPRVVALGFSQGVATVCRWIARGTSRADRLILWAGAPPPDLDLDAIAPVLRQIEVILVAGTEDRWATEAAVAEQEARLAAHGIPCRVVRFAGGHQLDRSVLASLPLAAATSS